MRGFIPSAAARSRSMMVAVVIGTALTASESKAQSQAGHPVRATDSDAVRDISRYCQACWRNARLPADRWEDCTQQVFSRLLETVEADKWATLLKNEDDDRREFFRAIDAVKKRTQRARRYTDLTPDVADVRGRFEDGLRDQREVLNRAVNEVLSPRQQRIVELTAGGWAVPEIAQELGTTTERISDEKYKAIRKLRNHLRVDDAA